MRIQSIESVGGEIALDYAVTVRHVQTVQELIQYLGVADLHRALHVAVKNWKPSIIEALLEIECVVIDVDHREDGYTHSADRNVRYT